jgi:UDP-3-O-[3-hydroxymyristoyl] glucosamine N-acyltransferase
LKISIAKIAEMVNGRVSGDADREIQGVAPFEEATETDISFAADAKHLKHITGTKAGALIVPLSYEKSFRNLIFVENPKAAFAKVMMLFHPPPEPHAYTSDTARIGEDFSCGRDVLISAFVSIGDQVVIGDRVSIHPGSVIGNRVIIGHDTVIEPNVTVMAHCRIGSRVIIHAGTVIGSDGFGFAMEDNTHQKIPQIGNVVIGDDVELGANNTIDRATFGSTIIGNGVKTDNLVHIAHNVQVGENTLLIAQVGIAGSTKIGNNVILAGQVAIGPHVTIGDNVIVGPQSGIAKSIPDNEIQTGTPGMPHKLFLRVQRMIQKLPELNKKVLQLEKRLKKVEADSPDG